MPARRERIKARTRLRTSTVTIAVAASTLACASWIDSAPGPEETPAAATAPPSPNALLRAMTDHLRAQEAFSFHVETNFELFDRGQKLQFAGAVDVELRRPDGMRIDYRDDLSTRLVWYDGNELTLVDPVNALYASAAAPAKLDDALDQFEKSYGLVMPLTDLISEDAYELIASRVLRASYVGLHDVDGEACHHLVFAGEFADLQLWIRDRDEPVPCKIVVDNKDEPGRPSYIAVMMDWEFGRRFGASHFVPEIPEGARRIEFLEAEEARR